MATADTTSIHRGAAAAELADKQTLRRVLVASSLGTLFEWYDFFLYGSLAIFFGGVFFPAGNDTAQLLGGFLPLIATALTASTWARERFGDGAIYAGLLFPIAVCVVTVVVSAIWIRETKDHKLDV